MVKIIQDREGCIGCGTCAALCPNSWTMNYDDAKADLNGAKKNEETGEFEAEITDEEEIKCNKDMAESCPVRVVRVEE